MSKTEEIMNVMNQINYGFLNDSGANIFLNNEFENTFSKIYYLLPPKDLLEKKVGVCWDQVELERKLFLDNNIKCETYFIYFDDNYKLPTHTFLVYYEFDSVYWFEHAWSDYKGIHKYNDLYDLLMDVENKFVKSIMNIDKFHNVYIYRYDKPNYYITCEEFYNFIFTQEKIINCKLENTSISDLERIKNYKLKTIMEYAKDINEDEMKQINSYISESVSLFINEYQNIIYKDKIIGSILVRTIEDGLLLDEIFIIDEYRNMGIGSHVIKNFVLNKNVDVYLWVYKDNFKACNLYKNLGFNIKEETDTRYYMEFLGN